MRRTSRRDSCTDRESYDSWRVSAGCCGRSVAGRTRSRSGYWGKPEETDATFKATLAGSGEGHYLRTGDLGFLRRGELFLTGRLKDLIIVRGRNYYPHDLEWSAQQAHPSLRRGYGAAFSVESKAGELVVLVHEIEKQVPESDLPEIVSCIRRAVADEYELEIHTVVLIKSGTIPRKPEPAAPAVTGGMIGGVIGGVRGRSYRRLRRYRSSRPRYGQRP